MNLRGSEFQETADFNPVKNEQEVEKKIDNDDDDDDDCDADQRLH